MVSSARTQSITPAIGPAKRRSGAQSGEPSNFVRRWMSQSPAKWADSLNVNDNVGLVVGATAPKELIKVRRLAPSLPILIPGIGTQGGDLVSCIKEGNKSGIGILNISRDISFSGSHSANDIRQSAKMYVKKMNEALNV